MNTLSENLCIFATMLRHRRGIYQGEQLDFDPSENLEKSKYKGDKLMKVVLPAVAYIRPTPGWSGLTYISAGVSLFHSYLYGYSRTFRLRMSRRLTLFVYIQLLKFMFFLYLKIRTYRWQRLIIRFNHLYRGTSTTMGCPILTKLL